MDFAEPIDVTPVEVSAPAALADRTTLEPDGTLVIDILVRPACAPAMEDDEIVVCAPEAAPPVPGADGTFTTEDVKPEIQLAPNLRMRARGQSDERTGEEMLLIDLIYRF